MPAVQRILLRYARHDRETLEAFLSVAIELLDTLDGDADAESGNDLEDDFTLSPIAVAYTDHGPGCPVSDQDAGAWIEWNTMRGSQKRGPNILLVVRMTRTTTQPRMTTPAKMKATANKSVADNLPRFSGRGLTFHTCDSIQPYTSVKGW